MRRLAVLLLAALPLLGARPVLAETVAEARKVERFDLRAERTGLDHRVFLVHPTEPPPPGGYPVVYLLDGNATLPMAEKARGPNPPTPLGAAVLVGVGYPTDKPFDVPRRYRDLTPLTPPELIPPSREGGDAIRTGGRDDFLAFLQEQVKPAVESRLPIDRKRQTLFGHSLGGLFALYVLYTQPALFQTYVAADPAIWWSGQAILKEQAAFLEKAAREGLPAGTALLVETSGKMVERSLSDAETAKVRRLRAGPTGREVADTLSAVPGLRLAFRAFPDESHGSMIPLSVADALPFAFGKAP
ncbi:alpha/beta hydrolase [Azospirillum doebereinerae]